MFIAGLNPSPNLGKLYDGLIDIFQEYANADEAEVQVGIFIEGPAAAYANVWEWGNIRQTKKGPKTVRGINPDGSSVWLTVQAPRGYIRVNILKYWTVIDQEMSKVNFGASSGSQIDKQIRQASINIGNKVAKIISETAPVDKGDLSSSVKAYASIGLVEDDED